MIRTFVIGGLAFAATALLIIAQTAIFNAAVGV